MNKNTILIITHTYDIHVDVLEQHLSDMNEPVFRLNLDRFPKDYHISFSTGEVHQPCYRLTNFAKNESVSDGEIKSVWVRKRAPFQFISGDLAEQERLYAESECEHLISGFLASLDCYWMSHPKSLRNAQWKVEQLSRAQRYGFKVPASLITNNPEELMSFYQQHNERIIMKPLSESSVEVASLEPEEVVTTGVSTTLITAEHIEHIESIKEFPCKFQAYVDKQYELRVTVVGNKLFTAKIDSQSDERTRIDFRDFSAEIDYRAWQLPDDIASRCLEFVHSYGLQYGAIDLIYTPDSEYVFLENNPGGQFWFVEQLVPELQIMQQVANCLAKGEPQ